MSLKRERVKHLDHQTELYAPVIINIIIIVLKWHKPDKSVDLLLPDVMTEHKQGVLNVSSCAQGGDQLPQVGFSVVHLVAGD